MKKPFIIQQGFNKKYNCTNANDYQTIPNTGAACSTIEEAPGNPSFMQTGVTDELILPLFDFGYILLNFLHEIISKFCTFLY